MKVLYISGMYPTPVYPQKGIFCHEQVKALKKLGVDVDVVVPITVYDREVRQKKWTYEGVEIRYVRFFKLPGARDFHRTGINLFYALNRAVDLKAYDVYHADAALPAGQAAMIASDKYGKPFVVHGHGLDVFLEVDFAGKKNMSKIVHSAEVVYRNCDAFTGVSQKVVDCLIHRCDIREKCYVTYNGVNLERFYPMDKNDDALDTPLRLLSVGNLIDLKGHDLLICAVAEILKEKPGAIVLDIYGRGEKELELRILADELGISKEVHFMGYVSNEEIAEVYRNHDMFILPSWYEALGCVYLEAMASGLITVGCRENGIDEVINEGTDGFLVKPHSQEEITDVIRNVLNMDALKRSEVKLAAVNLMREHYCWEKTVEKLIEVYLQVCKK